MSGKSDDSIEEFFRKAVRQSDTTFRDNDWAKMEKMLDEQALATAAGRAALLKRAAAGITGAFLLILGAYLFYFNVEGTGKKDTETQQAAAGKGALDKEKRSPAASLFSPEQKKADTSETDATAKQKSVKEQTSAQQSATAASGAPESISDESKNSSVATTTHNARRTNVNKPPRKQTTIPPSATNTRSNSEPSVEGNSKLKPVVVDPSSISDNSITTASPETDREKSSSVAASKEEELINDKKITSEQKPVVYQENNAEKNTASLPNKKESVNPSDADSVTSIVAVSIEPEAKENSIEQESKEKEKEDGFTSRWNAAIVVAPDFSATTFGKMTAPGGAFGMMIGYRVLNRFTITSGVLKTAKKYEGSGSDYHPPYGYWEYKTNGVVPDMVYGQCSVIEIPVLIQYDIKQTANSRIYVAGGLSSYRMLNESYHYTFESPNPGAENEWSSNKPSSYAFSIGHFSAAYERKLFNGLSLGLEPYIKIPFKGIGWSDVNLFTTGLYINARYRF